MVTIFCVSIFWSLAMPNVVNVENEIQAVSRQTVQMFSAAVGVVMG